VQRQPRLAHAARPGQGDQPVSPHQLGDPGRVAFPADDGRGLRRQVVGRRLEAAQRGEPGGQPVGEQLVERLGGREVLEPVDPQPDHAHPGGPVPVQQRLGRRRQQDLTAVPGSGDPGDPVHVHPDVAVAARDTLAGVETHPDPHLPPLGPRVRGQAALHRDRCLHRIDGRAEDAEEGVPFGRHLDTVVVNQLAPHDGVVVEEEAGVVVTEVCQQPGRPLDVRHEEGDGARGQAHAGTLRRHPWPVAGARIRPSARPPPLRLSRVSSAASPAPGPGGSPCR
jgi:hypothetical protein